MEVNIITCLFDTPHPSQFGQHEVGLKGTVSSERCHINKRVTVQVLSSAQDSSRLVKGFLNLQVVVILVIFVFVFMVFAFIVRVFIHIVFVFFSRHNVCTNSEPARQRPQVPVMNVHSGPVRALTTNLSKTLACSFFFNRTLPSTALGRFSVQFSEHHGYTSFGSSLSTLNLNGMTNLSIRSQLRVWPILFSEDLSSSYVTLAVIFLCKD